MRKPQSENGKFSVRIDVDASRPIGPMRPIWRFFGADEPNYATMPNGRKLIAELGKLKPGEVYFRTHNLLNTGDGKPAFKWGSTNVYTVGKDGRPVYDWRILDGIFDGYMRRGVRPYAEIGFMPEALSTHPEPYRHHWTPRARYDEIYTGWSYPPTDYEKWADLVFHWVRHCVERYGRPEVEKWYWETWNEPNIGYWRGNRENFFKLHDYAIDAVRRALPTARVGGPDLAGYGGSFMRAFLEHCLRGQNYATGKIGTPIDFISFHAKGAPEFVDGHVRMGISNQLREYENAFRLIGSFPELAKLPIVVGESDPDGCAACQGPQLGYRNGSMYAVYTAECIARELELMDRHGANLEGALTWAFEFEDVPYFAGFRQLASNGIDLPVLNVFRMLSKMGGHRVSVRSAAAVPLDDILRGGVRDAPDVNAIAARDGDQLAILAWNYHDDDLPGPEAELTANLTGLTDGDFRSQTYLVDDDHSNAYTAWVQMGSPAAPSDSQRRELLKASRLGSGDLRRLVVKDGRAEVMLRLPRKGVALIVLEPVR